MVCFFSSRRRHTRYWRDWSSDVCLPISVRQSGPVPGPRARAALRHREHLGPGLGRPARGGDAAAVLGAGPEAGGRESGGGGKEGRLGGRRSLLKKNTPSIEETCRRLHLP